VLIVGLALSVAYRGFAATLIARLLPRHPWIAYVGFLVIVSVAFQMIVEGAADVLLWGSSPEGGS
jgi:predicted tellurium resistance membrane protein TerC